jgi:hypothetical protein
VVQQAVGVEVQPAAVEVRPAVGRRVEDRRAEDQQAVVLQEEALQVADLQVADLPVADLQVQAPLVAVLRAPVPRAGAPQAAVLAAQPPLLTAEVEVAAAMAIPASRPAPWQPARSHLSGEPWSLRRP